MASWSKKNTTELSEEAARQNDHTNVLDLSNNLHIKLDDILMRFKNVTSLKLNCCALYEIPSEIFYLEQLEELLMSGNDFVTGVSSDIRWLCRLKRLDLSCCSIPNLPETVGYLEMLEELLLSNNNFAKGITNAVGSLHRLKILDLSCCNLTTLPDSLGDLRQLEELDFRNSNNGDICAAQIPWTPRNNFSKSLNPAIGRLLQLKKLDLCSCELRSFPDWIGDLQLLEELLLSCNDFESGISPKIGRLRVLKILHLSCCNLTTLPDSIGDLEQLEELNLRNEDVFPDYNKGIEDILVPRNNFSKGVNASIGRLRHLKKLDLTYCELQAVPDWIGDLELLEELLLSRNNFENGINPIIGRLRRLKRLELTSCNLTNLPDSLGDLKLLEVLNLRNEKYLSRIMGKSKFFDLMRNDFSQGINWHICQLRQLKKLDLGDCELTTLPEWIGDLEQLEDLSVPHNHFWEGIHPAIGRLRLLKRLDLSSCTVRDLPDTIWDLELLESLSMVNTAMFREIKSLGRLRRLKRLGIDAMSHPSFFSSGVFDLQMLESLTSKDQISSDWNSQPEMLDEGPLWDIEPQEGRLLLLKTLRMAEGEHFLKALGDLELLTQLYLEVHDVTPEIYEAIRGFRRLKILHLSHCDVSTLPLSLREVEELEDLRCGTGYFHEMHWKRAEKILSPTIGHFRRLKRLHLYHCGITALPDTFGDLEQLEELNMSENDFSRGIQPAIGRLRRLKILNISRCKLRTLPNTFGDLELLELLIISENNFSEELNPTIGRLRQLKILSVGFCKMRTLPDTVGDLELLEQLLIPGNNFSNGINTAIRRLCRLKRLDLERCKITTLPDWIGDLEMLENLKWPGTNLVNGVAPEIGRLLRLKRLELRYCHIKTLPDSFGDLKALELLDLSGNNFAKGLSPSILLLYRLKILFLAHCHITTIPKSFGQLRRLKYLVLTRNNFAKGICPAIGQLHRLNILRLKKCKITTLPTTFGELEVLEDLDLSRNDFTAGVSPIIGMLPRLKYLDLDYCNIKNLPNSFGNLRELLVLKLAGNKLTEYPFCTLYMKQLRCIDISLPNTSDPDTQSKWRRFWQPVKKRTTAAARKHESKEKLKKLNSTRKNNPQGISSLPIEIADTRLGELVIDGNPITEPPAAIWQQGLKAIMSYLKEKSFGTDEMCPDTINIIGDVFAGKTSIAQSLVKNSPQPAAEDDRTRVMQQLQAAFSGENGTMFVNINDFGGHHVYHSVIPIFLPTDGLVILSYDISRPVKEQEQTVMRWLLTAIAKSKLIRVIAAGTRCDKISNDQRQDLENHMTEFISSLIDEVKHEIRLHINRLQQRSSSCDVDKLSHLRNLLARIQNADITVVSLSCSKPDPGLTTLREIVSSKLRNADRIPVRWFAVMRSIIHASSNRPYLEWGEVQKLYRQYVPDAADDKDLIVILSYLVSTSQVFWLQHHSMLKDFIFHAPQRILKVCKDVLDHDKTRQLASQWVEVYEKDIERYSKGILQQPFLMALLSDEQSADVSIEFLKNFNLISEIALDDGKRTFVIPSNLPTEEPPIMRDLELRLNSCPNSIVITLFFLGSVLPMSFFETSFASMLTIATALAIQGVTTVQWRDGLIILYDGVCFAAKRQDNTFTLASFSELWTSNPWIILNPIVAAIHENINASWHGATPESAVLCPACRVNRKKLSGAGEIEVTLATLASKITSTRTKGMCPKCAKTIPSCLCFPLNRDYLTSHEQDELKKFLTKHGMSVDVAVHQLSAKECNEHSKDFMARDNDTDHSDLVERLRKVTPKLIDGLHRYSVYSIVDALLASGGETRLITEDHRQDIEAERTDREKARKLLRIVSSRGDDAIRALAIALQSDYVGREDLAKLIL